MRGKIGKELLIALTIVMAITSWSIIVMADGGGPELIGDLKIGLVKNVVGDVMIDHEVKESISGEPIKKEERQLQISDIIYSNSIITTGSSSQLKIELFQSAWDEDILGYIVLEENTVLIVGESSEYKLESGKIQVYINGKSKQIFAFDSMEIVIEKDQEVEFEMQGSKNGGK